MVTRMEMRIVNAKVEVSCQIWPLKLDLDRWDSKWLSGWKQESWYQWRWEWDKIQESWLIETRSMKMGMRQDTSVMTHWNKINEDDMRQDIGNETRYNDYIDWYRDGNKNPVSNAKVHGLFSNVIFERDLDRSFKIMIPIFDDHFKFLFLGNRLYDTYTHTYARTHTYTHIHTHTHTYTHIHTHTHTPYFIWV